MSTYTVHAKRWAHGWELRIVDGEGAEVGVTQSRSMDDAERMARDYLALDLGADPGSFDVVIRPSSEDAEVSEPCSECGAPRGHTSDCLRDLREMAAEFDDPPGQM